MRFLVRVMLLIGAGALLWQWRADLIRHLPSRVLAPSPHAQYASAIRARGLDDTTLGRAWLANATSALADASPVHDRFSHGGEFTETDGDALAWRFHVLRGQRITVDSEFGAGDLFVDIVPVDGKNAVASGTAQTSPLIYDVRESGELMLRVQPELLRGGRYRVTQSAGPSLAFPVHGVRRPAIHGEYGAPRSGGRRRHEGVDIFAPRGTPVVAAVDGWITGATTNRLGGNVVWLWSPSRRLSLYYAHLDRHAASRGQRVRTGDVVGYVGTTGNARGTPPHLHFGVYASGEGPVDPAPFVVDRPGRSGGKANRSVEERRMHDSDRPNLRDRVRNR